MKYINYLSGNNLTESNGISISDVCEVCGRSGELCLSEIIFRAGYGSTRDGEELVLCVCGECIDRAFDFILNTIGVDQGERCKHV